MPCLPHQLPVQSCMQCCLPLLQCGVRGLWKAWVQEQVCSCCRKQGCCLPRFCYPQPESLSWGFEQLLEHPGGAFGTGVPCLLVFLGTVIYLPCLSVWKCRAVVGAKCSQQLRAVEVGAVTYSCRLSGRMKDPL